MSKNIKHELKWVDNVDPAGNIVCAGYGDDGSRYLILFSVRPVSCGAATIQDKQLREGVKFVVLKEYPKLDYSLHLPAADGVIRGHTFEAAQALCMRDYHKHRGRQQIEWLDPLGFSQRDDKFPPRCVQVGLGRGSEIRYLINRVILDEARSEEHSGRPEYLAHRVRTSKPRQILNPQPKKLLPFMQRPVALSWTACVELCEQDHQQKLARAR